jgi:hypothetical protein
MTTKLCVAALPLKLFLMSWFALMRSYLAIKCPKLTQFAGIAIKLADDLQSNNTGPCVDHYE